MDTSVIDLNLKQLLSFSFCDFFFFLILMSYFFLFDYIEKKFCITVLLLFYITTMYNHLNLFYYDLCVNTVAMTLLFVNEASHCSYNGVLASGDHNKKIVNRM